MTIVAQHVGARPPRGVIQFTLLPAFLVNRDVQPACSYDDAERWFAEHGGRYPPEVFETCRSCPVRQACLDWAVDNEEHHGVWGGMTPQQRGWYAKYGYPTGRRRITCSDCGRKNQQHAAHGKCRSCYLKERREAS